MAGQQDLDLAVVQRPAVRARVAGQVLDPNPFGPGEYIAAFFGMPELTGSFLIAEPASAA